ncbi:flagellar filament capping protein FliD [Ferruginivarius sediminum]|uniref:Flagellar hook-associated protein 2 n=1 Tax=Ferruginivarius sediminum TaxID=2661937 RepID=A0A369TGZ3_9PROT|nr:flagellar filament capping protein FliD [Ferruginivarius sediminum]RDD63645.1 hypothetical protein DRB17_00210 [Ferruginivarius sediminum]
MEVFNADNLVTDNGRVRFSGFGSGIDFQAAVDGIMEARRIPVDRLETTIEDNTAQIDALNDLQARLQTLEEAAAKLRGAVSFDSANDVFKAREAFASASRSDGQIPSQATSILTANVTNDSQPTNHKIEVLQTAQAHKIGSDAVADASAGLAFSGGAGTFEVNGRAIDVADGDSLLDVRDKINNANTGDNASGVSASVVTVSSSKNVLVLTADETGQEIALSETAGSPLQDLGIFANAAGDLKNEQQAARNAVFRADGLSDGSVFGSGSVGDASQDVATAFGFPAGNVTIEFDDAGNPDAPSQITFDTGATSLNELATLINDTADANARVVTENGQSRLEINSESGDTLSVTDVAGTAAADMNIAVDDAITRSTNTVDDLFRGVTLNLLAAERGTTIDLEIEQDEDAARAAITDFVDSFNSVKQFINAQRQEVGLEDQAEETIGVLRGEPILSDVESRLSRVLALGAQNVSGGIEVLGQIGIDFVENSSLSDKTLEDTLTIDDSELNESLLNDFDEVRDLFRFNFTSSSTNVTMLNFTGDTQPAGSDYTLDIVTDGSGNPTAASTINGVAGSVEIDGNRLIATDKTGAQGLTLLFNGNADETLTFNVSTGVASEMFFTSDRLGDETDGTIESEIDRLRERNDNAEERIDTLERRLEFQRGNLLDQFIRMEEALQSLENARQRLEELTKTLDPSSGN